MKSKPTTSQHSKHAAAHIDSIVKQEEEALERRTRSERIADAIGSFAGSFYFVALHLLLVFAWVVLNTGLLRRVNPFDPYPFSLLSLTVSVEAVILSSIILVRQKRIMRREEHRQHLNLQIDLLAEKEITKVLQMVQALCTHLGLQRLSEDRDLRELSQNTSIEHLTDTLIEKLPEL